MRGGWIVLATSLDATKLKKRECKMRLMTWRALSTHYILHYPQASRQD